MTDIAEPIEELFNELKGLPGIELPPAADVHDVVGAGEGMGIKIPPTFGLLALLSDGITIEYGQEQYLSFNHDDPLNFVRFNDPTAWQWAYGDIHPQVTDFVYFAIGADESLHGWRRSDLLEKHDGPVETYVVVPSVPRWTGEAVFYSGPSCLAGLRNRTATVRRTGRWQLPREEQAILDRFGPIPRGKRIMTSARELVTGEGDLPGAVLMDATAELIARGELVTEHWRLIDAAGGQDVDLQGVEPWEDELGRTRLRWITA